MDVFPTVDALTFQIDSPIKDSIEDSKDTRSEEIKSRLTCRVPGHEGQPLTMFAMEKVEFLTSQMAAGSLVCVLCIVTDMKSRTFVPVGQAHERAKEVFAPGVQKFESQQQSATLALVTQATDLIRANMADCHAAVNKQIDDWVAELEDHRAMLLLEITALLAKPIGQRDAQKIRAEEFLRSPETMLAQSFRAENCPITALSMLPGLKASLTKLYSDPEVSVFTAMVVCV